MTARDDRRTVTVRILRPGEVVPPDDDWMARSMDERIEAVWMLTQLCHAWGNDPSDEPRLQRTAVSIQRAPR